MAMTLVRSEGRAAGRGPAARAGDRGQVSVELLGITPLILITLVLVWQFVLLGYTFTLAGNAADQAARAAAVGGDPVAAAGRRTCPAAWVSGASVGTGSDGDVVTAHASPAGAGAGARVRLLPVHRRRRRGRARRSSREPATFQHRGHSDGRAAPWAAGSGESSTAGRATAARPPWSSSASCRSCCSSGWPAYSSACSPTSATQAGGAARAAARTDDAGAGKAAMSSWLRGGAGVGLSEGADSVTATVTIKVPSVLPGISIVDPVTRSATMPRD